MSWIHTCFGEAPRETLSKYPLQKSRKLINVFAVQCYFTLCSWDTNNIQQIVNLDFGRLVGPRGSHHTVMYSVVLCKVPVGYCAVKAKLDITLE